jgi:hypothetical protein
MCVGHIELEQLAALPGQVQKTVGLMEQIRPKSGSTYRVSVPKPWHDRFSGQFGRVVKPVSETVVLRDIREQA